MKSSSLLSTDDTAVHFLYFELIALCFLFLPITSVHPASSCNVLSVFVHQMSVVCGGFPCLWISTMSFKSFVQLPEFLNQRSDQLFSHLSDPNHDSFRWEWAKGLQLKTTEQKSISVFSIGLYGPTIESILWVHGWCKGDVWFSSSRRRLNTLPTIWAQQPMGKQS